MGSVAELVSILKRGGVAVIPTDTIYGIVGSALKPETVAKIYRLRKRNPKKPLIVLIPSLGTLVRFGVRLAAVRQPILRFLHGVWPGRVSVALPVAGKKFKHLHRGTGYIAFRVPAKKSLRELLQKTGPLVAPSANIEGKPPATTIEEARRYFGAKADWYVDGGKIQRKPSALVKILEGKPIVLRR